MKITVKLLPWVMAAGLVAISLTSITAYADSPIKDNLKKLVPAIKSGMYYKMGGGDDIALPAFFDTSYIPLNADSDVGLGFDCGIFNPATSIRDSLNEIKNSAMNVERQVLNDATGAVTEFPLYELSRADPNLYNIITSAMAGAREDIAVSTKSCEVMQSEIGAGQNPYSEWGQISLGNRWTQEIGTAELSGKGDINQARNNVSQSAGKNGVPWVNPDLASSVNSGQTYYAGGENQPPIRVIHDTAISGYDVILNDGSSSRLGHNSLLGNSQSELSKVFPTAKDAAEWITNVVGDQTITTYNGGEKSSQPGVGLYSDIQYQTQQILPRLQGLVTGSTPLTVENLADLSPEGMALSPEVIRSIRQQPKVIQSIITDKLAQNIAAMTVINKARLAMRILQSGGTIPAIYSNKAAQQNIENAVSQLKQDVQDILMFIKARQTLMSNMLSTVMQAGTSQEDQNTAIAVPKPDAPIMNNGAISNQQTSAS
ncbi:MAG: integrating conjugative element protein [Gammaproteobacteria bacterium CG11_big_fil_rev_8_21_14_0_20_46_22]|nr:MAG: integrating conjugative element protein [Gammaproteobacteria bacterium CG12_big_fil_rev_8_21_14_0_65_46_12]PIR11875.1 MAG: integrating conjugative element protein [Gammaproteobacteria bacterium CG11_big_fil_rev_8_21_14_0_20_46_22]